MMFLLKKHMELFSLRKEIKYIVPIGHALSIRKQLDQLLTRDSYCSAGTYSVRSLYFDSINNTDFSDKIAGLYNRKKIRLRIYNSNSSLCKLEIKHKAGDWQQKQSCIISASDAMELAHGNYSILKHYFHKHETAIEAYRIMMQGQYHPVVQIEYNRIAYVYPLYDIRVTLDMDIRSSESNMNIFSFDTNYIPVMPDNLILEVKYNGKLMGFISDTLSQFNLTQCSYSKYCSGRQIYL